MQFLGLVVAAAVLRIVGSAARSFGGPAKHIDSRAALRTVGWLLCLTATWLAAGAAGCWFPLWPALVGSAVGVLADPRARHPEFQVAADVLLAGAAGVFSVPTLSPAGIAATILIVATSGFVIDTAVIRIPKRVRKALLGISVAAGLVGVAVVVVVRPGEVAERARNLKSILPRLAVTPIRGGERILLDGGVVAWLERPSGRGPFPGALLFHGADPAGSNQVSAYALRRALLHAGFVVLALDHPGYGESRAPASDADAGEWDPLPAGVAALQRLESLPEVDGTIAIGHSMGAVDTLRILGSGSHLAGAVLLGASIRDLNERGDYWYKHFHLYRRDQRTIPRDLYEQLMARYYSAPASAAALDSDHAPVLFVRFSLEFDSIVDTREALYEMIPGNKAAWVLGGSTHHFSTYEVAGLMVGDSGISRRLAKRLRLFADQTIRHKAQAGSR